MFRDVTRYHYADIVVIIRWLIRHCFRHYLILPRYATLRCQLLIFSAATPLLLYFLLYTRHVVSCHC